MHILFANTGVQVICVPLSAGRRYTTSQIGYGWQYCRCLDVPAEEDEDEPDELETIDRPYIQWQIIQADISKLFLAVDTTMGDPEIGFFADPASLSGDFRVNIQGMLDLTEEPLQGLPDVEICLRAATSTAVDGKPVNLVCDCSNSRTGALIDEVTGEVSQTAEMTPFELANRYTLNAWNDEGDPVSTPGTRWFSSKTGWCNIPYLPPREATKKEYFRESVKGLLRTKQVEREREVSVRPTLFDNLSMVRLGREVNDVNQVMHAKGDFRTTVSSPKRYLWAADDSWLEGAFWYMADPHDQRRTGVFASKLQGPLLKYIHEDDRDFLLDDDKITDDDFASEVPVKPRHAPRCLMTAAIYELLCQVYAEVNSEGYRSRTDDPARTREVHSLTMTYPSGMFQLERERFQRQCQKAIEIFSRTLGKHQRAKPQLTFSIDEASAVHLTYIWSELSMLGQDPRLWFAALSRDHSETGPSGTQGEFGESREPDAVGATPASRRRSPARIRRPGSSNRQRDEDTYDEGEQRELRIACIDIGGGTTDLMIATYKYQAGIDDSVHGRMLHRDGVAVAGDQLVKRMLERIIVPAFAQGVGLEPEDTQLLFGPSVPKNRGFASQRIDWVNRMLVPLAEAYIQAAIDGGSGVDISHTEPEIVDPAVVESLDQAVTKLRGVGYYDLNQELHLEFDKTTFEDVVHEVFDDLLFDFCSRMVDYEADVVLLAGQPSKIGYIQELIRTYMPLPSSRIVPMFNHYAGNWYPYQDVSGSSPGLVVDPKSAVVVGAAIEFMARNGMLSQFKFSMTDRDLQNTYYWGVMTESTCAIRADRILFEPAGENTRDEWTEFSTIGQRMVLGRKVAGDEDAQASPIYVLKMDAGDRIGPTNVTVRIRRILATETNDEQLEVQSANGTVAGEPAVLGENVHFSWRTIADERFFLDTGGLDNIETGA